MVSPDGTRALTGSADSTARIWALHPRGAEQVLLTGHHAAITALTIDADAGIVTGSADASVRRWHTDGRPGHRAPVAGGCRRPRRHAHRPDAGRSSAGRFDTPALRLRRQPATRQRPGVRVPDLLTRGVRLAAGAKDNTVHIFDVRARTVAGILRGHADWIGALAWSPSGRYLASGSDDRTIQIWDMQNPNTSIVLAGHQNYVDGLAWAPDERSLASCSADWTIRIWDPADSSTTARVLTGHDRRVRAVAYSPDGVAGVVKTPRTRHSRT